MLKDFKRVVCLQGSDNTCYEEMPVEFAAVRSGTAPALLRVDDGNVGSNPGGRGQSFGRIQI